MILKKKIETKNNIEAAAFYFYLTQSFGSKMITLPWLQNQEENLKNI